LNARKSNTQAGRTSEVEKGLETEWEGQETIKTKKKKKKKKKTKFFCRLPHTTPTKSSLKKANRTSGGRSKRKRGRQAAWRRGK